MSRAMAPPASELTPTRADVVERRGTLDERAAGQAGPAGWVDRLADALPGLMFLVSGLALLAAVAVVPGWLAHHEYAWRLSVMQAQAEALRTQTQRYERFAQALRDDDPVVLERLAMTHLRLGMAGKQPLWVRPVEEETGDVGAWLSVAQPELGVDVPFYAPPRSRLVRLVMGPGRPALLLVGLMCVVAGVLFNPRSGQASAVVVATRRERVPAGSGVVRPRVGALPA